MITTVSSDIDLESVPLEDSEDYKAAKDKLLELTLERVAIEKEVEEIRLLLEGTESKQARLRGQARQAGRCGVRNESEGIVDRVTA